MNSHVLFVGKGRRGDMWRNSKVCRLNWDAECRTRLSNTLLHCKTIWLLDMKTIDLLFQGWNYTIVLESWYLWAWSRSLAAPGVMGNYEATGLGDCSSICFYTKKRCVSRCIRYYLVRLKCLVNSAESEIVRRLDCSPYRYKLRQIETNDGIWA